MGDQIAWAGRLWSVARNKQPQKSEQELKVAKDSLIRLGCWAAESALRFVPKVFDDFFSPLVDSKEK